MKGTVEKVFKNETGGRVWWNILIAGAKYATSNKEWAQAVEGTEVEFTFKTNAKGYHTLASFEAVKPASPLSPGQAPKPSNGAEAQVVSKAETERITRNSIEAQVAAKLAVELIVGGKVEVKDFTETAEKAYHIIKWLQGDK